MALEARVLFDAAAALTAEAATQSDETVPDMTADAAADMAFAPDRPGAAQAAAPGGPLIIVDPAIGDFHGLIAGLNEGADIVVLDPDRDGVHQIAEILAERTSTSSLHIFSDGAAGSLKLGSALLSQGSVNRYVADLTAWNEYLSEGADISIWGCNVAAGAEGEAFIDRLALLTGADIAASDDPTGAPALGGDWMLEYTTGAVAAASPLSAAAIAPYGDTLALIVVSNNNDSGSGSLREALLQANAAPGADVIMFDPMLAGATIAVSGGEMLISDAVQILGDIDGDHVPDITLDAAGLSRIFRIDVAPSGGTDVLIEGLTLANGLTSTEVGGAVRIAQGAVEFRDGAAIGNRTIGTFDGAAFYVDQGASLAVDNVVFEGNQASRAGGGIYAFRSTLSVSGSRFIDNHGNAIDDEGRGGAIAGELAEILIDGSYFSGNSANFGGAIHLRNVVDPMAASTLTITDTIIEDNAAHVAGGGLRVRDTVGLVMDGVTVRGNVANDDMNSDFTFSQLKGGGGLSIATTGTVDIRNSFFLGNRLLDGQMQQWGGGIHIALGNDVQITDTEISGNVSTRYAGGLGMSQGTATLTRVTLDANRAENAGTQDTFGGNIAVRPANGTEAARLDLIDTIVTNGFAEDFGGGIHVFGSASGTVGNVTRVGGAVSVNGGEIAFNSAIRGGGLNIVGGTLTMDNVSLQGNEATGNATNGFGGGLDVAAGGSALIQNSTIWDNEAEYGGGIYLGNPNILSEVTGINVTISGNRARDTGGGVRVFDGSATFLFSTIAFNRANIDDAPDGTTGGIAVRSLAGNTLRVGHTIVSGNSALSGGMAVIGNIDVGGAASLVDFGSNIVGAEGNGAGTVDLQPLAVNNQNTPTHALGADSIARDAGNPANYPHPFSVPFPVSDQRGGPFVRIFNGVPDIGAFEAQFVAPVLSGGTNASYTEPDGPQGDGDTVFAPLGITVSDADSASFAEISIVLTDAVAGDALLIAASDLAMFDLQYVSENGAGVPGTALTISSSLPGGLSAAAIANLVTLVRFRTGDAVPLAAPDRHAQMTVTDTDMQGSDPFVVTLAVTGTNDTPAWASPGATPSVTATEDMPLTLSAQLSDADLTPMDLDDDTDWMDPGATPTLIALTVGNGSLTVDVGATGVTVLAGPVMVGGVLYNSVNGSGTVVVMGSSNDSGSLDALLDGQNGGSIVYLGNPDFSGADTLTLIQDDRGDYDVGPAKAATKTVTIDVEAVADAPILDTVDACGEAGSAVPLDIVAALADTDGSETLRIEIAGVPPGAFLSAGMDLGGGKWSLLPGELAGLSLSLPADIDGGFDLSVTAIATETSNDSMAATSKGLHVEVKPQGDVVAPGDATDGVASRHLELARLFGEGRDLATDIHRGDIIQEQVVRPVEAVFAKLQKEGPPPILGATEKLPEDREAARTDGQEIISFSRQLQQAGETRNASADAVLCALDALPVANGGEAG